jgi:hypothetical protein
MELSAIQWNPVGRRKMPPTDVIRSEYAGECGVGQAGRR